MSLVRARMRPLRRTGKGDLTTTRASLHSSTRYQVAIDPEDPVGTVRYPPRVRRLDLTNHVKMTQPPDDLPVTLEHLDLPENIDYLPPSIGRLKHLKTLNITSHKLQTLPPELGLCKALVLLYMPYCPRMEKGLWRMYQECEAYPMSAGKRPGPLLEHLERLVGYVITRPPKRWRAKTPDKRPRRERRRSSIMKSMGLFQKTGSPTATSTPSTPGSAKTRASKLQRSTERGNKLGELLAKARSEMGDAGLTVEQLSYERDLRDWQLVNPRPQPPAPKYHGYSIEDYDHKVDTSNWPILHTLRKPNPRFVSPYDFMQFTQAQPNKLSIFSKDEDTGKFTCTDPIMYW